MTPPAGTVVPPPVSAGRRRELPPGQRALARFPRFGQHLARRAPVVPVEPVLQVRGAVVRPFDVPLRMLATMPRRELEADFHCVTGWSAVDLRWEGVAFAAFYRDVIAPALAPGAVITHIGFRGLDGYRSIVLLEDALGDDVLIAEHLDGQPLDGDHGAPVRLVSPTQYGYVSTKHLCRIDLCTTEPRRASLVLRDHPRARVWEEERHGFLPGRVVRPVYRALKGPLLRLCALGASSGALARRREGRGAR